MDTRIRIYHLRPQYHCTTLSIIIVYIHENDTKCSAIEQAAYITNRFSAYFRMEYLP